MGSHRDCLTRDERLAVDSSKLYVESAPNEIEVYTVTPISSSVFENGIPRNIDTDDDFSFGRVPDDYSIVSNVGSVKGHPQHTFAAPISDDIENQHNQEQWKANDLDEAIPVVNKSETKTIHWRRRAIGIVCCGVILLCASAAILFGPTRRYKTGSSDSSRAPGNDVSNTTTLTPSISSIRSRAPTIGTTDSAISSPSFAPTVTSSSLTPSTSASSSSQPSVEQSSFPTTVVSSAPSSTPTYAKSETASTVLVCTEASSNKLFNAVIRPTESCEIRKADLVLDESTEPFSLIDGREDIELLTVYADTVTIASSVSLPQTNIIIYARSFIVQGNSENGENCQILTIPRTFSNRSKDVGANGEDGHDGGNVTLNVKSISLTGTYAGPVFQLDGAAGQEQGPGLNGTAGSDNLSCDGCGEHVDTSGNVSEVVYIVVETEGWLGFNSDVQYQGELKWPEDGAPAIAAGSPGRGGNGGSLALSAQIDGYSIDDLAQTNGAPSGEQEPLVQYMYSGGVAGMPRRSVMLKNSTWYTLIGNKESNSTLLSHEGVTGKYTEDGLDAYNDTGFNSPGVSGSITELTGVFSPWLHPAVLKTVWENATAQYLDKPDAVEELLLEYVNDLDLAFNTTCSGKSGPDCENYPFDSDHADEQQQYRDRMDQMLKSKF